MPAFDNSKATDEQREEYLQSKNAYVENHGDDKDPLWIVFYDDEKGRRRNLDLDAQNYDDAIFEACGIV